MHDDGRAGLCRARDRRPRPRSRPDLARALNLAHLEGHPARHDAVLRAGLQLTHEDLAHHARDGGTPPTGRTPPWV
ncbi:hypothetical protein GCM10010347_59120 [Streptomyces cirratus]|uniref:Uncharacterized protein n=1 Tax=Streptomyces cirratus TaxID=68187 RepID=A0ABQ3F2W0_9ACTN|nr:hypothetical protein GCM10010347_59120 [Streptomyces cirratus]